jgi:hypothetical protein
VRCALPGPGSERSAASCKAAHAHEEAEWAAYCVRRDDSELIPH